MNLTKLRQILTTYFDENELRDLCFDLDVDYDGLPGEGKTGKARELVAYLNRRKRLPDLVKVGKRERPDISWPEVTGPAQAETTSALPPMWEQIVEGSERASRQAARSVTAMELPRQLKVFLCHASGDKPTVRDLYHRLRAAGFDPWLDEEKLLPGQNWQLEIPQAVRSSDAVVICLSRRAVTKAGFVQKEIRYALDVADEQPEGAIFLIPLRLEECEVPQRLRRWQWVDFFEEKGYERLMRALRARAKSLGLKRYPFEPEMVFIPAGEFLMGSDPRKDERACDNEQPQHTLYLPDYYIARTPITNAQYAAFIQATSHTLPQHWKRGKPPVGKEEHPVVYVSWYGAVAYCNWLSQVTGKPYRLPSEAEWEKGARGTDGRHYPWGDDWDPDRCNGKETGIEDTTPVGAYPDGASPYGLLDMAGNVWEWTRSLWGHHYKIRVYGYEKLEEPDFAYPYDPEDGREDLDAADSRVVRGGTFEDGAWCVRCAYRFRADRWFLSRTVGFRVCVVSQQD
jgi:formylglycine-generating enzyme required for sulfatase activity